MPIHYKVSYTSRGLETIAEHELRMATNNSPSGVHIDSRLLKLLGNQNCLRID